MEELIKVVNRLQDAFAKSGLSNTIDLPQIAVVGGQSAGKSSVLENCVGRDFLPRGSGIVTRRPLILQLLNHHEEYGEFLHKSGQKFYDFAQIRKEIEVETDRVTGSNKNISPSPINLRIYSPNVLNLTLVDLPGLTKVPVGDQPADIGKQIRNMVCNFISNKNCLILAVTPANTDLANSDALLLASEVDPNGSRTIGVITKIDIMDRGTNCRDILLNISYPLKRGYVGVVNRSQADIDGKIDIHKAQELESEFFRSTPAYADIADKCGTKYMQNLLFTQLAVHIKETLPSIKNNLYDKLKEVTSQLGDDDDALSSKEGKVRKMMNLLQEFCNNLESALGFGTDIVDTSGLSFGAEINQIMNERFPYEAKKVKPPPDEMRKDIMIGIKNAQGVRSTVFTPDIAFTAICRKKISALKPVSILMMEKVTEQLRNMVNKSSDETLSGFPLLASEICAFVLQSLGDGVKNAKDHLITYMDVEHSYINTNHPEFVRIAFQHEGGPNKNDEDEEKAVTNTESTRVYRKGMLQMPSSSVFKSYKDAWFVIKGSQLICFKDEQEKEIKFNIDLTNCTINSNRSVDFVIVNKTGAPLLKDNKQLNLRAANEDEAEDWKAAFFARGVQLEGRKKSEIYSSTQEVLGSDDPMMNKQVEYIRMLVDAYLRITIVHHVDLASKMVMHHIIGKIRSDLRSILQAYVFNLDVEEVMKEDVAKKEKRDGLLRIKKACKEALDIIGEVSTTINVRNTAAENYSLSSHSRAFENLRRRSSTTGESVEMQQVGAVERPVRPFQNQASFKSNREDLLRSSGTTSKAPSRPVSVPPRIAQNTTTPKRPTR